MKYFVCILCIFISLPCYSQQRWTSNPDKSNITFTASYDDADFKGHFARFDSEFSFNPEQISTSELICHIDITSVDTQSRDRDQALAERNWFYFSKFPQATFISQSMSQKTEDSLEIKGLLTIRDREQNISFLLQWSEVGEHQRQAKGQFTIDRRDYDVGIGEWLDDETIGFEVDVNFIIHYELN